MESSKSTEKQDRKIYWQGIVKEWEASGKTKTGFCKERGITANYLSTWHQRLEREARGEQATFVPLKIAQEGLGVCDKGIEQKALILELKSGHKISVTSDVDEKALRLLFEVLGVAPC